MRRFIGAIDQGTTSSRFIIFNRDGKIISVDRREHAQIYPRPGWVEHDAMEIWRNTLATMEGAIARAGLGPSDFAAIEDHKSARNHGSLGQGDRSAAS